MMLRNIWVDNSGDTSYAHKLCLLSLQHWICIVLRIFFAERSKGPVFSSTHGPTRHGTASAMICPRSGPHSEVDWPRRANMCCLMALARGQRLYTFRDLGGKVPECANSWVIRRFSCNYGKIPKNVVQQTILFGAAAPGWCKRPYTFRPFLFLSCICSFLIS